MSRGRKEAALGYSLPEYAEKVKQHLHKGESLIYNDFKTVALLAALYRDFAIDCVYDMAVGSGTAAIAASLVGCAYDGVAANQAQADFVNSVFERAYVAMCTDKDGKPGATRTREGESK